MTGDDEAFGERLRACRAAAGLSQEDLAGRSGVSVRAIGNMERGQTRWPNRDSARLLADALGLAGGEQERFLALARRPVAGAVRPVPVPYRGLSAYGEQDAGWFFGREEAAARVLELMSASLGGSGLVVVSGVSGAGKSSLLQAGVLPRLGQAGLAAAPQAASWPCLLFTPGRSPLAELAVRIAPLARTDASPLRRHLAADPPGFAVTARQAALAALDARPAGSADTGQRRVVLAVDQCEQLFTACPAAEERQAFITALCAAAGDAAGGCPAAVVVLVTRADFEARLADFPPLATAVQDRYLLTAMTRRQLRLAITGPAVAAGSGVEEELLQVLQEEAGTGAGAPPGGTAGAGVLPLLSHALDQAWRTRAGQTLTLADYERAGGIEGAVAASAQRAYQALTPAQQDAARQVFTRLTATSPDGTDTAVPAARADLTAGDADRDVETVLERFAAERLLTLDAGTVAISHEVLLTAWPLLRDDWLTDSRADRVTRTRLHATSTEWARASRDPSYLYSGARLDAASSAAARIGTDPRQPPLSPPEIDFLQASHRAARRSVRTRHQLTAVLMVLVTALTAVWVTAVRAGHAAAAQRDIAVSRLLISQSEAADGINATAARLEALAAWALDPSPQARYAMLTAAANPQTATITAGPTAGSSVAFSPDGKTLATTGPSSAQLWDLATRQRIGKPLTQPGTFDTIVSPDAKMVVTLAPSGAQLWDLATGRRTGKPLTQPGTGPTSAAFSPDDKMVAIDLLNGVRLWDISTGQPVGKPIAPTLDSMPGGQVLFSPDGKTLATVRADNGTVQLWNVATGQPATEPPGRQPTEPGHGQVHSVAFSPDSKTLATGTYNGTVRLWDPATGKLRTLSAPGTAVAFSPDGKTLATSDGDSISLWDAATGQQIASQPSDAADDGPIASMTFSPDGKTLATSSADGVIGLWSVAAATFRRLGPPNSSTIVNTFVVAFSPDGKTMVTVNSTRYSSSWQLRDTVTGQPTDETGRPLAAGLNHAQAVAFTPNDKMLATADPDGVFLWDFSTGQQAGKPIATGPGNEIGQIVFSPDGKTVATVSDDNGTARLWDVDTGQQTGKPMGIPSTGSEYVFATFSPDGNTLAITNDEGTTLWNVATGHQASKPLGGPLTYPAQAYAAFSPDGKTLTTFDSDGVTLWNVATGQQIETTLTSTANFQGTGLALSPDGETLATISESGVRLWDLATGQQIGSTLTTDDVNNTTIQFSPDGTTLAAGSDSGVKLWDVGYLTDTLALLCSQVGGSLTPAEWARYVQQGMPYRNACVPAQNSAPGR